MFLVIILVLFTLLIYIYVLRPLKYWEKKNVKFIKPVPFFGNMLQYVLRRKSFAEITQNIYNSAPNDRCVGFHLFNTPMLVIRDANLIKQITVKDFDVFSDHRDFLDVEVDPLWSNNLLAMKGESWRSMRPTLSPSFTSSKMKAMFTLMVECAEQFVQYFLLKDENIHMVEMKDVFTRYSNDVIGTCAFGVQCDSLSNKTNDFYQEGKIAADFSGLRVLGIFGYNIFPALMKLMDIKVFRNSTSTFFRKLVMDTISTREEKGIVRPDMIHLLMEARKGKLKYEDTTTDTGFATVKESEYGKAIQGKKMTLTEDEIVAQALIFFVAGFDTSATLMCFLAYELALHPDIQEKLFNEVEQTLKECEGTATYEAIMEMKYLDMTVTETLRKWPPFAITDRRSNKPYTVPSNTQDGKPLHLPSESIALLPIYAIQRDPLYYPDPDKFDPERFSEENKQTLNPFAYLPFGAGPRNCIGARFALLETKIIIFSILRNFEIAPIKDTKIPMVLSKTHLGLSAEGGMWLGLKPRKLKSS